MGFNEKLHHESEAWVKGKLISAEQQKKILEGYPVETAWYKQSGFLLRALALSLFAAALILLISANWDQLPRFLRSGIALLPMLTATVFAWVFYHRSQETQAGQYLELSLFFVCLTLGANIFLQAQIYHISAFFPNGFLWWMIGILPVILFLESRLTAYLLLVILFLHTSMLNNFDQASLTTPAFLAISGWIALRKPVLPFLLLWFVTSLFSIGYFIAFFDSESSIFLSMLILSLFSVNLLSYFYNRVYSKKPLMILSGIFEWYLIAVWFAMTFAELPVVVLESKFTWFMGVVFLASAGIRVLNINNMLNFRNLLVTFFILTSIIVHLSVPEKNAKSWENTVRFIYNITFLGSAIALIIWGLRKQNKTDFFSGVVMIVVLAVGRYLDLIGEYITSSLLFAGSGILIWLLNKYWEKNYGQP
ncbi:MAG: DUF2157 domain-containing protein [Leptospiraceae bacterium]|nr:DUF2157 domain-containing protein [Leptospiraceae bacterium]